MAGPSRTLRLLLCGGLAALLYLTGLGRPALWEPDEGRYAEVAREMVVSGDYLTPRNDWVRYFEKPPLVYWTTAASLRAFGRNEFAVRFQAAAFSVGQVVATEALGEAMFDVTVGLLAAIALALSPLFFIFARFATPDPALAFFLTTALASFYRSARTPDLRHGQGRNMMLVAAAMLALGTLAKGPVALILGGGIALLWLVVESRVRDALRVPWLRCVVIYVAITAPWFVLVSSRNPGFLEFFFVHEHLQRYLQNTEHGWGPWFFVPIVIGGTWPWVYFLAFAKAATRKHGASDVSTADQLSAIRFLLIWFAVIFLFFSVPRSKLGEYILPTLPPLAILAAVGIANWATLPVDRSRRILLRLALLNSALAIAAVFVAGSAIGTHVTSGVQVMGLVAAAALALGSWAAVIFTRSRQGPFQMALPIAAAMIVALTAAMLAREFAASDYSYRRLARAIGPYTRAGCVLGSYRHFVQALPFYTGVRERLVGYRGELAPFGQGPDALESFVPTDAKLRELWQSDRCIVLVANRTDLPRLVGLLEPRPLTVGCEGKKFALVNRALSISARPDADECGTTSALPN